MKNTTKNVVINNVIDNHHQHHLLNQQSRDISGVVHSISLQPPKEFNINQPASRDSPRGRTSEVVRVKYREAIFHKKPYAVKRISMPWAVEDMKKKDSVTFTEICTEMKILQQVEHPFIVKLHWSLWNEKYAVMIFDYYQMGSFLDLIASTGPLSEEKAKFYTAQLVLAIEYLHETKRIVHRDIKGENILVDNEGYLKITDFGKSNMDDGNSVSDYVGTIVYMASEVLAAGSPAPYLRKPTDIWSLGVVIYTMLFRKFPYECNDTASILQWISERGVSVPEDHEYLKPGKNGSGKPELLAPRPKEKLEIRQMLLDMFKADPKARLTIKQIKDHDSWNTPSAWIKKGSNPPKFDWEALQTREFQAPIRPRTPAAPPHGGDRGQPQPSLRNPHTSLLYLVCGLKERWCGGAAEKERNTLSPYAEKKGKSEKKGRARRQENDEIVCIF
ncbi:protein kinase domain-containing protein [Ditylenchus destructor]|uniref:Protein kinase domain-containing protein n=1 Tax=Ditylenchus destructor TaxID=166010 RepID=A0AAD4MLL0_9BILA|nr:protein kinase domain-containing protein [Ditylenchus destructor]